MSKVTNLIVGTFESFSDKGRKAITARKARRCSRYRPIIQSLESKLLLSGTLTGYDDAMSVTHDQSVSISPIFANDSEYSMTMTAPTTTQHGTVYPTSNGGYGYLPNEKFVGTDTATFTASNGIDSASSTITITVTNTAPQGYNNTETPDRDTTLIGYTITNDSDSDTIKHTLVSNVTHGTLTLTEHGSYTYVPNKHYYGPDSFSYRVNDGITDGNVATVTINVQPVEISTSVRGEDEWTYSADYPLNRWLSGNNKAWAELSGKSLDGVTFNGAPDWDYDHEERLGFSEEIEAAGGPTLFTEMINGEAVQGYKLIYRVKWQINKEPILTLFINIPDEVDDYFEGVLKYYVRSEITLKIYANGTSSVDYKADKDNDYYNSTATSH